jgi:hypothetical protein
MKKEYAAIADQMAVYFDGLYHSDTQRLKTVFHPQARYVCATGDELVDIDMETYFPIVESREAPAARRETRQDSIVSITFAGPDTAQVRAHCAIGPRYFTDLLTFIRTESGWRIISKVFHYDLSGDQETAADQTS